MRLQVKVDVPLVIRMCLECPFYRCFSLYDSIPFGELCVANRYLSKEFTGDGSISLGPGDSTVIPDKCPLLKLEEK